MALEEQLRTLAERVPPPPPGDAEATFRDGVRRRRRRQVVTGAAAAVVIAVVAVAVGQLTGGLQLTIEPAGPGGASVIALPEPGVPKPVQLDDGTPVFVSHLEDGEVVVLDATSPHAPPTLLLGCEPDGGIQDPRSGSAFTARGTWMFGPAPTGLPIYPHERVSVDEIRVTGTAGPSPPRPSEEELEVPDGGVAEGSAISFCFGVDLEGPDLDRAYYHWPAAMPPRGELELPVGRWEWVRADIQVQEGQPLLCAAAPCDPGSRRIGDPDGWLVRAVGQDARDQLFLARLRDDGLVDVRLPALEDPPVS